MNAGFPHRAIRSGASFAFHGASARSYDIADQARDLLEIVEDLCVAGCPEPSNKG